MSQQKKDHLESAAIRLLLEHPYLRAMLEDRARGRTAVPPWHRMITHDYASVLVFDRAGHALVLEDHVQGDGMAGWQLPIRYLTKGEDPTQSIQQKLLQETGYFSRNWQYIGGYALDALQGVGVGHFYCAQNAFPVTPPPAPPSSEFYPRWVVLGELKFALIDGRFAQMRDALNVSLALLTVHKQAW
ncbi:MAG: NUDIX domain-containing protein [Anaerolineae bacterium]